MSNNTFKLAIIAGEVSGDDLAADLLVELKSHIESQGGKLDCIGLGGERLKSLGVPSLFNIDEIAVMGLTAVIARLPNILKRVRQTARHIIDENPDLILLVDSPEFSHAVAKRIRDMNPNIPIYQYVSPSVWAWRSWRAPKMKKYIDHIFTILPFEADALKKLGGPSATYVGHPLVSNEPEKPVKDSLPNIPTLLVLPGSRKSEISRLVPLFGKALNILHNEGCQFKAVLPAVPHLRTEIERLVKTWDCPVDIVDSQDNDLTFSNSHLALAASGTVSLQLAMHHIPMVIAYKLDIFATILSPFLRNTWSIVLPNLIANSPLVPEFINSTATPTRHYRNL